MAVHTGLHTAVSTREERRQRAVEALGLGEDVREERFDRITRLAKTLCNARMSTITVLDGGTARYPGACGYDGAPLPRGDTFCDRTTHDDAVTIVPDARVDPRFSHLPLVRDGGVRFYAGAPLRDHVGNVVGVLCVFDPDPAELEGDRLAAFEDIARWAQQELVASSEAIAAARVQSSLLPQAPIRTPGWDVAGVCLPALAVGGDFYDYGVSRGVLHLGLGDVMGKGTGAALLGAGVRAAIRGTHAEVVTGGDLGVSATRVARSLADDLERTGAFASVFEAAVNLEDGTVRYVDAGLGLVLVVRSGGDVERLCGQDRPFGVLPDDRWQQQVVRLDPGDRLVVFSDGLLDLVDDQLRWWAPIGEMILDAGDTDALLAHIAALAAAHTALDDVTTLVVHRLEAA